MEVYITTNKVYHSSQINQYVSNRDLNFESITVKVLGKHPLKFNS